jgi:hypothetical protein
MADGIEIYIRPSGGRNLLHFHVPTALREQFVQEFSNGNFDAEKVNVYFEMPVRPEYFSGLSENHLRFKIDSVSLIPAE